MAPDAEDGPRVLIVEDDPSDAMLLRQILDRRGYRTDHATDGREGLKKALEDDPDLVISDVLMPEMDGFKLCRQLKSRPESAGTPVMLVTNLDRPEDLLAGMNARADWYITKPFDADHLLSRTEALLEAGQGPSIERIVPEEAEEEVPRMSVTYQGQAVELDVEAEDLVRMLLSLWEMATAQRDRADETRDMLKQRERELEEELERIREMQDEVGG